MHSRALINSRARARCDGKLAMPTPPERARRRVECVTFVFVARAGEKHGSGKGKLIRSSNNDEIVSSPDVGCCRDGDDVMGSFRSLVVSGKGISQIFVHPCNVVSSAHKAMTSHL